MSKLTIIIMSTIFLTMAFFSGRWSAVSNQAVFLTRSNTDVDENWLDQACRSRVLTVTSVNIVPHAESNSVDNINKELRSNSHQGANSATDDECRQLLEALAIIDPHAAMAQAARLTGDRRNQAVSVILKVWGEKDPEGVWNWVQSTDPDAIYQFDQLLDVFGPSDSAPPINK